MNYNKSSVRWMQIGLAICALIAALTSPVLQGREWRFVGIPQPMEAEFVGMQNNAVVLQGPNGKSFELPFSRFSLEDQRYLKALSSAMNPARNANKSTSSITKRTGYQEKSVESLTNQVLTLAAGTELHITGTGDPIPGCVFNFSAPNGWLFFDHIAPSTVVSDFIKRMRVAGRPARLNKNLRVVQYGDGAVVLPHGPKYPAMTVFADKSLGGKSLDLNCYVRYGDRKLGALKSSISSFILKRGYMATIAQNEDGTGISRNYVAQDHDVEVSSLPRELDDGVQFIRVFPWRWIGKKGVAGAIHQKLNVDWFYDWNIEADSSRDLEYVAIRQNRHWPGLDQNWEAKGINHLLGYNEPDRKDQSNMSVDDAISGWPGLLETGLRLGSPAPSDGGLPWLYEFMEKAEKKNLRVDFVAVHYYRASGDPGDAKGAANRMRGFLEGIHNRLQRPIWITEWNNGANWTKAGDPNEKQQKEAIAAMIKMLDETPYVERYALYNWVEDCRNVIRKDESLTPSGEVYRDNISPLSYLQAKPEK